jgi:hypothetical protein
VQLLMGYTNFKDMLTQESRLVAVDSAARLAAVLLLALLSHFALMATPLHAEGLHSEAISSLQADLQHCLGCGPLGLSTRGGDPADDCALQLAPRAGLTIRIASGDTPFGQLSPFVDAKLPAWRLIETLGPPGIDESQAFLQVFRN